MKAIQDRPKTSPLIIGHRGASRFAPENTMAAFQLAYESGADGIEFDVQLSKDGVPVVIHDHDLKRTAGQKVAIAELTSRQLAKTDVGSWFNNKFPTRSEINFSGETVIKLSDLLKFCEKRSGPIYCELKSRDDSYRELVAAVVDVVKSSSVADRVIMKSFKLAAIPEIRCRMPEIATAALFSPTILKYLRSRKHIIDMAHEFGAAQISLHHSLVTKKLISLASAAGMPVTIWTTEKPTWVNTAQKLGIKAIITNDPAKLIARRNKL